MWLFFGVSVAVLFASSVADLLVRAVEMSGNPIPSVIPVLPTVIFRTHYGSVWLIRIAVLVLLSILLRTGRRYLDSNGFLLFLLALGLIAAMTETATGHASDAGDFSVAEIMDWLHLAAASVWGGGLFVLSLIILPKLTGRGEQKAPLIAGCARRFSRIAAIAVWIIALTAVYHARVYVGSVDALVKTPYGQTIIAKIVLFFFLLSLGAFNRYIIVPRLQEWAGVRTTKPGAMRRLVSSILAPFVTNLREYRAALQFMRSVRTEALLMLGVLLCVSLLRHEVPARHFTHLEHMRKMAPNTQLEHHNH
jgi:copper resistance protein D